ncbi:hypothetical protein C8Q80DRAFT_1274123 [Daedaleopsis nitida]|nr:hypothetical protein C8Q80DRAFT_1274123 [Daedaleopsis nitida]
MPLVTLSLLLLTAALSYPTVARPHDGLENDAVKAPLPGTWYHVEDHPVHALFKRGEDSGPGSFATIGSPEWSAGFPGADTDSVGMPKDGKGYPQAWIDALITAVEAGMIPDIPPSSINPATGLTVYPNGLDTNGPIVCSATYQCHINGSSEIWDAPEGVFASSFDDGPLPANKMTSTHFMIGVNIRNNPDAFKIAFEELQDDIAVHTWKHPMMTTLNNLQVVGELGWTMQLIHNSTCGRVPKYWRPPLGDSDERVKAIAREVFRLTTLMWNQDTEDWSIEYSSGATRAQVDANLQNVGAFMQAVPVIAQNGWHSESVARINSGSAYQNAGDDESDVVPMTVGGTLPQPNPGMTTGRSSTSSQRPSGEKLLIWIAG